MVLPHKKTAALLWFAAILAGLLQAWSSRFMIEPDGVNYLDIAYAYTRHDWHSAVNSYWSPLYSWVLGLSLWLTHAPLYEESTLLHMVNFFIYLLALSSFAYFLRQLSALGNGMAPGAWLVFAYALFVYATLFLIGLGTDTPDLCVAAFVFLATGMLIRMRRGAAGPAIYAGFGAVLGTAYLAKAVMFPLAFVFLVCAAFAARAPRRAALRVVLSLATFLAIATPFLLLMSRAYGRLTFGDTGRLNYAFYVDGLQMPHWHGELPGLGTPVHGTRLIFRQPEVDEFATPVKGTYPPWYDGAYWFEGVTPHFELRGQLRALREAGKDYFVLLSAQRGVAVGLLVLLLFSGDTRGYLRSLGAIWPIWLPALSTLALYALVHVETRFLGAAVAVLWCSLFTAIRLPSGEASRRLASCVGLAVAITLVATVARWSAHDFATILRPPPHGQWQIAADLRARGLISGDRVAVLGHTNAADYWAHLAEVRVVADMPYEELSTFWDADPTTRARVLDAFAHTGARFLVTPKPPPIRAGQGWLPVGQSGYYALPLESYTARSP